MTMEDIGCRTFYTRGPWGIGHSCLALVLFFLIVGYIAVAGYLFLFRPLLAIVWLSPMAAYMSWTSAKQKEKEERRRRKRTRSFSEGGDLARDPNNPNRGFDIQASSAGTKLPSSSSRNLLRSRSFPLFETPSFWPPKMAALSKQPSNQILLPVPPTLLPSPSVSLRSQDSIGNVKSPGNFFPVASDSGLEGSPCNHKLRESTKSQLLL
eukprot:g14646.t1